MDPQYLIGIDEIDAQHKEIDEVASAIIGAIATNDQWHIVHYIVVRLYELLRFHFSVEESVMRIVGFPDVENHKRVHEEILQAVDKLKVAALHPKGMDSEEILRGQTSFLAHIIDHDKRFVDFVAANRARIIL